MNKIFAMLLTAVFALSGVTAPDSADTAVAPDTEPAVEIAAVSGAVTEIADDFITLITDDGLAVQANLSSDTLVEYDVPGSEAVSAGDYIHVFYNGMMTRSLPAQISALTIRCAARAGKVVSVGEDHFMLQTELEEIQVNAAAEQLADVTVDSQVKVYFDGAMTMSLPAQISADLIVTQ